MLIEFEEIAEDPFLRMLLSIFIANVLAMAGVIYSDVFLLILDVFGLIGLLKVVQFDYLMFWNVS